jgi:hypothetical protein
MAWDHYSVTKEIVSEKDPKFNCNFWKGLFKGFERNLNNITTYHPDSYGQIKRTNKIIKDMLRMYVMDQTSKWEDYIDLVEFAYNNGYQLSLQMSPFKALYRRKCNTPMSWDNLVDIVVDGVNFLKEMEEIMTRIKHNLKASQDRQKHYADNKRVFIYFKVGKHVFLKVKEKRNSLKLGSFPKLAARYCGPFEILESIGTIAYIIALSTSTRVHNVFHVSLLKKYIPNLNHIIDWIVILVGHKGDF